MADPDPNDKDRLATLGRALASLVHEIVGPLQSITALAELLERDPDRGDRVEAARRILRAALRCRTVANDVLCFARERSQVTTPIDIRSVVLDVLDQDRHARAGDIEFRFDADAATPWVLIDPDRFAQVVTNLLRNAREATAQTGGGSIRVEIQPDRPSSGFVSVAVDDEGPGVPASQAEEIFEAFVTSKRDGRGTGLGLHVARSIVESSGGTLRLEPKSRPGARFVVTLPLAAEAPTSAPVRRTNTTSDSLRVLVVDDDHDLLETYRVVLAASPHIVVTADRGRAAVEQTRSEAFDVIICDLRLPDLSGAALLAALDQVRPGSARKVVFATGDVVSQVARDFLASQPNPPLIKPFRISDLEEAIRAASARGR